MLLDFIHLSIQLPKLHNAQWIAFSVALVFSLWLTPMVIERAIKMKLLSKGGGRHVHSNPTPRLGGVAVYLSCLLTSLLFILLYGRYTPSGTLHFELLGIFLGATLIFVVGLLDDLSPLPAHFKLFAQAAAAIVAWSCHVQVKYIPNIFYYLQLSSERVFELPLWLSFLITVGWLVLITNALNLIDGLDGLAGGVSLITALSLWAIFLDPKIEQVAGALLSATIAGSVLGFLRSNYNPAQIFLGDSGAYFLGFTLGAMAVAGLSVHGNTASTGSVVVIAFSFPVFETIITILRRFLQRKPLMEADADHIHHKIIRSGISSKQAMWIIYATCALLGLVACTLSGSHKRYLVLFLFTLCLALISFFWKRKRQTDTHPLSPCPEDQAPEPEVPLEEDNEQDLSNRF